MFYIYRITNLINGKTYIGQHKYKKLNDSYMGSGKILKQSIKKHGIENFRKEILYSRIQYKETADDMERFAIAKERAIGKAEYNIAAGGGGTVGVYPSQESRNKMSKSQKGNQNHKGKYHSEETKRKISETKKGHNPWNKGKSMPEEFKKKMEEIREAYRKSGRKDWNIFQKEYKEMILSK